MYFELFNLFMTGPNKHNSAVTCLQFNTRFVITSSDDGTVKLWDVKTGNILFCFVSNVVELKYNTDKLYLFYFMNCS